MIVNLENEIYIYLFSLMKILNCLIRQNSVQRINDVLLIKNPMEHSRLAVLKQQNLRKQEAKAQKQK